jgi:8-oxo-dGTP pyrophosphatase MutT (NUDIX family)
MASPNRFVRQAAAIAVKDGQVCLITSRSGRRWIIPKGMMETGKTAAEIALQEAWEEAGLVGALGSPVGTYQYEKYGGTCLVTVFTMQVLEAREQWPEAGERRRVWVSADEAIELIEEESLREILRHALLGEAYSAK